MAVMTGSMAPAGVDAARRAPGQVVPIQRNRRGTARPVTVVRICSDAPIGAQPLLLARPEGPSIAAALPIQRDRRARRARSGSTRRLTTVAVAFGISLLMWVAIIVAVAGLGHYASAGSTP